MLNPSEFFKARNELLKNTLKYIYLIIKRYRKVTLNCIKHGTVLKFIFQPIALFKNVFL